MSWRYAPWSTRLVRFQKPGIVALRQITQHHHEHPA
jgi:hypothetical protein